MAKVTAADGTVWPVGRRWLPWRPRRRNPDVDLTGAAEHADDLILGIGLFIALLVLSVFASLLLPFVLIVIEAVLLAVAVPIAALLRTLLRRPGTVVARPQLRPVLTGTPLTAQAPTFRAAGALLEHAARDLARTGELTDPPWKPSLRD